MRFTILLILASLGMRADLFSQKVILEHGRNTFFLHAPNRFKIHVAHMNCKDLFVAAKLGVINKEDKSDCEYSYWNNGCSTDGDRIIIYRIVKQDTLVIDTVFIRLSDEALKSVSIGFTKCSDSFSKCSLNKNEIRAFTADSTSYYPQLTAQLLNWDITLHYKIVGYSIDQIRDNVIVNSHKNMQGSALTDEWIHIMQSSNSNDHFKFYDVHVLFDGCEKSFDGPAISIE